MDKREGERRVAVFTGSRAEYGLLRHLIAGIWSEQGLKLQLIVSGSHLSACHGNTLDEIKDDGHKASALIPLSLERNPAPSMGTLCAEALKGVTKTLEELQPELLIVLGDRYETFAAATAAHLLTIPIVHLHGGETSEGAVDDRLRHAITQLSTWHFTAAEKYRERVIKMGQPKELVWNVGPMALDGLVEAPIASRKDFERATGFRFGERNLLITYHPETLQKDRGITGFKALMEALRKVSCNVLITHPNADSGREEILSLIQRYIQNNQDSSLSIPSLGQKMYYSALQLFEAMAGNSSSGIIEAPLMEMPVLNIGERQKGRLRTNLIIDVGIESKAISDGLESVLEIGKRSEWPRPRPKHISTPTKKIIKEIKYGKIKNYNVFK